MNSVHLQHEVHRKLGRCLLRLQQYERQLKSLLPAMSFHGPLEELQVRQEKRNAELRTTTLGGLVTALSRHHLSGDGTAQKSHDIPPVNLANNCASAGFFVEFVMPEESLARTKADLLELVNLRNSLVHHFIENFDIRSADGCQSALTYLDRCFEEIDRHFVQLRVWGDGIVKGGEALLSAIESREFANAIAGTDKLASTLGACNDIEALLRTAAAESSIDGWAELEVAIAFVLKSDPSQGPRRHGCKTWRQVLQRSGQFELKRSAASAGTRGRTLFRSRINDESHEAR